MEISLLLKRDSANSCPSYPGKLELASLSENEVVLMIDNPRREMIVDMKHLIAALQLLEDNRTPAY